MKASFLRSAVIAAQVAVCAAPVGAVWAAKARQASSTSSQKGQVKAVSAKSAAGAADRKGPAQFSGQQYRLGDAKKEELADRKRDEAIVQLKKIIPKIGDGSSQKADLLFQLSELYWEKQRYLFTKANLKHDADYKAYQEARNRGEKVPEPKLDTRESELYRSETMRLYETILREYPEYGRKDEVLFALGYNLYEIGKQEQGVKRYVELIKDYPDSRFVPDTYIQLGNHYFENNKLLEAKQNFERALATNVPKIYSYALYKLAWCDYNAGTYEDSLKKLHDVIAYAEKHGKEFGDLKNEALRDLVLVYVQLNQPDEALAYFKAKAPKSKRNQYVARVAFGMADAGFHESAIKIFRTLNNEEPMGAQAPEFQQAIVRSFEKLRQRDKVKEEIQRLAELYRPGSTWWKTNGSNERVLTNAFNVSEEAMRSLVTDYHQEAQKTKQVETYRLARDIYKQYVESFASSTDEKFVSDFAFNLRFYFAEILWALEEWEDAAAQYEQVVTFKIPNRDTAREVSQEKYRQAAAYNAVLAYEKLVKIEKGELAKSELKEGQKVDEHKKKGTVERNKKVTKRTVSELQEQPLSSFEQKLVAACDTYNNMYPNNPDEIDVRYQAAVIYYDRNHFVEATERLGQIIMKWPQERRSQDAADLSMSVLEEKEEWLALNKLSRQFLANKKLTRSGTEFAKRVATVVEGSQYKWIDEVIYKKDKNPKLAAEEFIKFVAEFPKSDNADRALTYAMLIFKDADQLDRGIEAGERVLKEYSSSPFELKVRFTLAKFYEQTANFRKSAEMNEAFISAHDEAVRADAAKKGKGRSKAQTAKASKLSGGALSEEERKALLKEASEWVADAQFNAALWWEGLGEREKAISAYTAYMTRFKTRDDVPEIQFNIGLIYEKDQKWAEAIKAFETFNTQYAKDKRTTGAQHYRAKYRQFLAHRQLKNTRDADRLQAELLKSFNKLGQKDKEDERALHGYAHVRFLDLEPLWKSYQDIRFEKVSRLKADFAAKQRKIAEVEKAYTAVLATGAGEWGIAALSRIGLAYSDFARNILDSPEPKNLDEEQLEMYRGELENLAFPLEEKGIEALEKALAKAYELSIYNEWTLLAQEQINRYRPGFYSKAPEVTYQGSEFFVTAPVQKEFGTSSKAAASKEQKPKDQKTPNPSASLGGE